MESETGKGNDAEGPLAPDQVAVALDEYRNTLEKIAAQEARWAQHVDALFGAGPGGRLSDAEALALWTEHRAALELATTQKALWHAQVEAMFGPSAIGIEPMADPRIATYYRTHRPPRKPAKPQALRKAREKRAWKQLRDKVKAVDPLTTKEETTASTPPRQSKPIDTTRSKAMSKEEAVNSATGTGAAPQVEGGPDAPVLDWGEAPANTAALTFKTAKGSTYTVNPDGTTTRNKAARPEHPDDFGMQPPSQTTFYVDRAGLNALGEFQSRGNAHKRIAQVSGDMWGIQYTNGPQAGKFERRTVVEVATQPQVGMIPVELWKDGAVAHFGNAITKVDQLAAAAPDGRLAATPTVVEKEKFEQAKQAALADPAAVRATNAGRFALDQAHRDRMAAAPWAGALEGLTGARAALGHLTPAAQPENTIEPVLAVEATPPAPPEDRRLKDVLWTTQILTSGRPDRQIGEQAASFAAGDIAALDGIREPHQRLTALLAVAESRYAQIAYKTEFDRQAPALAAEVEAAVAERFGEDYANRRAAQPVPGNPALEADRQARARALDAAALEQLAIVRETERQEVARIRGRDWTENTIERADVAVNAPPVQGTATPAVQPAPALAPAPAVNVTTIPAEVERAFLRVDNKFYMPKNPERVAFEDHGAKLKTLHSHDNVALAMVQVAHARGWTSIKVSGDPEFCKKAWREASLRGLAVQGYKPTALDLADLQRRMPDKANEVAARAGAPAPVAAAPAAAAPATAAAGSQPGIYISAEDAALLATAKAALRHAPGAAQAVAPAAAAPAAVPAPAGDILVSHGPAPYQHDPESALSYVVKLRNAAGREREVWGVNLGRAIDESGVKVGDRITLVKNGEEQVEVDAMIKNEAGKVVGMRKIGAVRNDWVVKAHALATQPPAQAVAAHPDLAGMLAKLGAVDKQAAADGLTPVQRAYVAARAQGHAARDVERGNVPKQRMRENVESKRQPQQEMAQ